MIGQALAQCIHMCGMYGQDLANCISMMLGLK
ncbi:hypothetical protein CcarbDRAFT_0635 [Clostridium carboxidivorans P7]|uniref:Uncharacterized protein n=1 Tax=Clostridium carboxidivorans P7 TaxID=536227 RepID=C6PPB8_9CLOT|nr:hypothetical protein CcarbDRAFT_0635 [Clostridium carboxidivorans P7]